MTNSTTPAFEVGKTYVCRNGTSLRKVVHIKKGGGFVVIDKNEVPSSRNSDGTLGARGTRELDLISEYKEPVIKKLYPNVVQNNQGEFFATGYSEKPSPYVSNSQFKHLAVLEVVITDASVPGEFEVSAVNIIK